MAGGHHPAVPERPLHPGHRACARTGSGHRRHPARLAATALMTVYRSGRTDKPVSRAGWGYAGLWVLVIGARSAFSYGSVHWFGPQLGHWMTHHDVTSNALTAALIFMAVGMLLTRTVGMAVRATHLAPNRPINAPAAMNAP